MIHLWNAMGPHHHHHHHHAWTNLPYLLGLHGGCKCCLPAPSKAHATAGQSRSAMQVITYLNNITACSLILGFSEIKSLKCLRQHHSACDFFFLITVVTASACSCRSVTSLDSCQRWTHHVWLQNGTSSVLVCFKSLTLKVLLINITQSISTANPLPLQFC